MPTIPEHMAIASADEKVSLAIACVREDGEDYLASEWRNWQKVADIEENVFEDAERYGEGEGDGWHWKQQCHRR